VWQPTKKSDILMIFDLNGVDVTVKRAEISRKVLSGNGSSAGGWRCCQGVPGLPQGLQGLLSLTVCQTREDAYGTVWFWAKGAFGVAERFNHDACYRSHKVCNKRQDRT
jgi:hypothetical protein